MSADSFPILSWIRVAIICLSLFTIQFVIDPTRCPCWTWNGWFPGRCPASCLTDPSLIPCLMFEMLKLESHPPYILNLPHECRIRCIFRDFNTRKNFSFKGESKKNQNKTEEPGWLTRGNRLLEREADFTRGQPCHKAWLGWDLLYRKSYHFFSFLF